MPTTLLQKNLTETRNISRSGLTELRQPNRFSVMGVGSSGCNIVETIIRSDSIDLEDLSLSCVDTDCQRLDQVPIHHCIQICRGQESHSDPKISYLAVKEAYKQLKEVIQDSDLLFIITGLGGGTGTGAAPAIAEIAQDMDILTIAVVTTPFKFEGKRRMVSAEDGFEELSEHVDFLIAIPNDEIMCVYKTYSVIEAFKKSDVVVLNAVHKIIYELRNHSNERNITLMSLLRLFTLNQL